MLFSREQSKDVSTPWKYGLLADSAMNCGI